MSMSSLVNFNFLYFDTINVFNLNDQRDEGALCNNPGTSKVHKQKMAITLFGRLKKTYLF